MIAWASTTWTWYWRTLSWAGIGIAFLIAFFVISLSIYLISLAASHWRRRPAMQTRPTTQTPETTPVPQIKEGPFKDREQFGSLRVKVLPPTLNASLYVGDIRFSFADLKEDRHSELIIRVFNGSGRVVELSNVSGQIKFAAPNNNDPFRMGVLPTPSTRPDTAKTVVQLREWILMLSQRVPNVEAVKLLRMIEGDVTINFDLSELNIEVFASGDRETSERLPIWDGVTYNRGVGFGRIIAANVAETLHSTDKPPAND